MDRRQKDELDRHITGNYGEDQIDPPVPELRVVQRAIWKWANSVPALADRTPADAIKKLSMEEVPELWRTLRKTGEVDKDEIADILILVFDVCEMAGIDPLDAVHTKMMENVQRKWVQKYGVVQHED